MTITITFGWWLLPLLITVVVPLYWLWDMDRRSDGWDFTPLYTAPFLVALILGSWLIWSLVA